jgi:hypothetical protein
MAQFSSSELEQELHSVRGQLAAEQSRSFCLEVDVVELRQSSNVWRSCNGSWTFCGVRRIPQRKLLFKLHKSRALVFGAGLQAVHQLAMV